MLEHQGASVEELLDTKALKQEQRKREEERRAEEAGMFKAHFMA